MYIDHIKTFLEVTTTGSFQLAAEKLHVTQSSVSARIKALETQLNRTLFVRKRSGAELTAGGQRFHPHALNVVRAWERARQEVALPEEFTAIVNLGIQLNHWSHLAAPWLAWMETNASDVATQITAEYSDALMRQMRDGTLELAVLYEPQHCPGVKIEPLLTEEVILVSTEPRTLSTGRSSGYIYVDWGDTYKSQYSLAFPDAPTIKLSVGLGSVGLEHILNRGGSGYFIASMVGPLLDQGKLHKVKGAPVFERPLYLVYQEEPLNAGLLSTAIQGLQKIIR
ncbi:MAG: DNA-binding transcriptional LysR family regulator [Gammaproteobacteria bacterium]|jgi:DNA-binding transcriptional LysR family regulator